MLNVGLETGILSDVVASSGVSARQHFAADWEAASYSL